MTSAEIIPYSRTKDAVSIFSCDYYICVDIVSPHMWVVSVIDQRQRSLMATQFSWYKNGGHFRFAQNMRFRTEFLGLRPEMVLVCSNLPLYQIWDLYPPVTHPRDLSIALM